MPREIPQRRSDDSPPPTGRNVLRDEGVSSNHAGENSRRSRSNSENAALFLDPEIMRARQQAQQEALKREPDLIEEQKALEDQYNSRNDVELQANWQRHADDYMKSYHEKVSEHQKRLERVAEKRYLKIPDQALVPLDMNHEFKNQAWEDFSRELVNTYDERVSVAEHARDLAKNDLDSRASDDLDGARKGAEQKHEKLSKEHARTVNELRYASDIVRGGLTNVNESERGGKVYEKVIDDVFTKWEAQEKERERSSVTQGFVPFAFTGQHFSNLRESIDARVRELRLGYERRTFLENENEEE